MQAAKSGKVEDLQRALQKLSSDEVKKSINGYDRYNYSALHHAARSGNVPIVKLLIAHGAGESILRSLYLHNL